MDAWLDRLRKEITDSAANLTGDDWTRAPQGRWDSARIMEHLARTYGTTAKMLELWMEAGGAPQVRPAKLSESFFRILIIRLGVFPSGVKAPAMVQPRGDSGPVAYQRALDNLQRMELALKSAEARWGNNQPIAMHPFLGPLSPEEWRAFHYRHGHHHIRQMRKRLAG